MRKNRRKRRFDYGDMYTKPQNAISSSSPMGMALDEGNIGQAASPYYSPENLNTIVKPVDTTPRMSAEQKGSLIGAAGQLVGSAIESKQKMQDTEFTQDLQKSRKEAKAALYGIGTAAAAVNPIVGGAIIAGTAIGSAIGSQTQGEWGQYKSRSGNAIDEMVNPVTGYQGIKRALQGKQTASGAVNKLTLGLFGKSDNQKDAEKGKRDFEAARIRKIKERSQQTLANYNTSGISDYNTMLAMGGFLPKYTKRGKRRLDYGGLVGKPEPKTTTDPLEEEGDPNQAASPYYSPENLNALTSALKPQPQANPPPGQQPPKKPWVSSPTGQAVGGAAMAASSLLPQYNNPNQTAGEKATDEAGVKIAGAIGPWWGALAKVGTTASSHIRKDDTGSHARGFIGDTVNPFHQFNSLQEGKGSEKTAAFLNPVAASHLAADRRKRVALGKKRLQIAEMQAASQQKLANYNMNGNIYAKYGTQFPMGGELPTPTDNSGATQLASNMAQYDGSTHEGGGIDLDTNQDAQPDIEVEGTEVIKDNMVYSNRLRPSKDVKNIVRESGVSTKKGDTYATLSARIGKKKGKFEEQMQSTRPGEKNSAQIMQGRLDETANLLFMDQQVRKFKKDGMKKFPKGGRFKAYKPGERMPNDPKLQTALKKWEQSETTPPLTQQMYPNITLTQGRVKQPYYPVAPPVIPNYKLPYGERNPYDAMPEFPNGGNVPPKRKGTGFTAPVGNKDAFKRDALGKNRAILEKDKTLKTLDIGRVDFDDWNQRGADNPDNPLNDPNLLSVDRRQILDRFRTDNKLFATTFARFDPGNSPEQQKLKGSWMDNDIYMDAPPKPLPEVANTPPPTLKLDPAFVQPQLYQYKSWEDKPKKPYGGYTTPGSEILPPRRRGRTVTATKIVPPAGPFGAIPTPVVPVNPAGQYPYSTPQQAPPPFSFEDETRRLEALKTTPTYAFGGYTKRLHGMNDALKTRAFGGYLPAFADGDKYKRKNPSISNTYIKNPFTGNRDTELSYTPTLQDPITRPYTAPIKQRGLDIGDYKGDIAAGIGTIANQLQINKLETQFDPEIAPTPRNPYTDRRDYLTHQANEQFRTASQGIEGSDAQSNLALKANMYAKSLSGLNQSMDQEQQREDMFGLRHADTKNRTDLINAQTKNQAKMISMENRNQKRALTQANIDNLIRSYQGNEAVRGFTQTEHGKNLLAAIQSGDRGTSERLIAGLSPKMRRQLGFEAEGGIFKKGGIYIKPKNRGKFNALKKRTGKTTAQLKHSKNPLTRKRATFAANAKKWKH